MIPECIGRCFVGRTFRCDITTLREAHSCALLLSQHVFALTAPKIKIKSHASACRKSSIKSSGSSSPTETRTVPGSTLAARSSASDIL